MLLRRLAPHTIAPGCIAFKPQVAAIGVQPMSLVGNCLDLRRDDLHLSAFTVAKLDLNISAGIARLIRPRLGEFVFDG
jgi:hypothetical protein